MNTFVNYVGGVVTINTFAKPQALLTTIEDLMAVVDSLKVEDLVAVVSAEEMKNPEVSKFIAVYSDYTVDMPIEF